MSCNRCDGSGYIRPYADITGVGSGAIPCPGCNEEVDSICPVCEGTCIEELPRWDPGPPGFPGKEVYDPVKCGECGGIGVIKKGPQIK
jgi:hypothetical protein